MLPTLGRCLTVIVAALCLGSACALAEANDLVHLVRTPNGGLQPQVALDNQGNVHLVYLHGDPKGCDVFYSCRKAGATDFSQPIRVNSEPGCAIALGTVRGAQLAVGRNGRVHVAWNGAQPSREPGAKGAPMLYARLDSSGRRFEPQRNLMTSTMNLDGGGSVAADTRGNVYVVWHAHPRSGPDDEVHRAVYVARSTNDGLTFAPEQPVTGGDRGVCGCCGLKAFCDERGRLAILYRSADEAGNRDSMLLVSKDEGKSFQSLLLGKWHSPTCPMSTPDLGIGPEQDLLALWETQGQVYRRTIFPDRVATSPPAMAPQENPGDRKHPVFAMGGAKGTRLLMAWVEGTGWDKGGSVAWEYVDRADGSRSSGSAPGVSAWDLAAVFPEPDGTFTILY